MPTTILLARHGQTDWNLEGRVQGHTDRALDETGLAQARALADELDGEQLDAIYSSDLVRAMDTARHVADRKGLPVTASPDLREKHFGTWEGLTDAEVIERFPEAGNGPWGDAETGEAVERRVLRALRRIADAHPGGRVLVVSHGGRPAASRPRLPGSACSRTPTSRVSLRWSTKKAPRAREL